jgi:hypothetical protein
MSRWQVLMRVYLIAWHGVMVRYGVFSIRERVH